MAILKKYKETHFVVDDDYRFVLKTKCRKIECAKSTNGSYYSIFGAVDEITTDVDKVDCIECIKRIQEDVIEKI